MFIYMTAGAGVGEGAGAGVGAAVDVVHTDSKLLMVCNGNPFWFRMCVSR